ncbi:MAG: hypothetical protein ACRDOI_30580 [Trebonia sp.]
MAEPDETDRLLVEALLVEALRADGRMSMPPVRFPGARVTPNVRSPNAGCLI